MESVADWLRGLGLGVHVPVFDENHIDWEVLRALEPGDLRHLGLSLGHRKRLLRAIAGLSAGEAEIAEPVAPPTPAEPVSFRQVEPAAPGYAAAERRQLTIMFCDIVGSTALAERLDPEDLRTLMRTYQNVCSSLIERYEGHVAQYLGDGVMAYFGWPSAHEDDAERALRAALDLVDGVGAIAIDQPLKVRLGVGTGQVVVGNAGAGDATVAKLAVGETPNLAARLQELAAPNQIVIGPNTRRLVGGTFDLDELGRQVLKGVVDPVPAWRVIRVADVGGRFEARSQQITPLVGRQSELALLMERWAYAKDGDGQVVLLSGEPGIGKSRITKALRDAVADEPHIRLRYQCSPYYVNTALYPSIEQFELAAGFAVDDTNDQKLYKMEALLGQALDDISEAAPLFAAALSLDPGDRYPSTDMSPQQQKECTLLAMIEQVEALSEKRPVLMIMEDAHWIDPTTQEVIDRLTQRIETRRVLLVITHRPEYRAPRASGGNVSALSLSRLDRRQAAAIVEATAGSCPLPRRIVEEIVAVSDGVPLFVEEMTKSVVEAAMRDGDIDVSLATLSIPTTLQDSLMARLDRLGAAKEVAQLAATIGRSFSHALLAEVMPPDGQDLDSALATLEHADLVFRRGVAPDISYIFKHALVQDAAYGSLLKRDRQRHHETIARALVTQFPDWAAGEPELVAYHYTQAGQPEPAIDFWLKAGRRSAESVANLEAIAHLRQGLDLIARTPQDDPDWDRRELALQVALGSPLIAAKGYLSLETNRCYERARDLCHRLDDPPQLFPILFGLWVIHLIRAELVEARATAEDFVRRAEAAQNRVAILSAHRALGSVLLVLGEFSGAQDHLERALKVYDPDRDRSLGHVYTMDPKVTALRYLAWSHWCLGYPEKAQSLLAEMRSFGETVSHPYSVALGLMFDAVVNLLCGEAQRACETADACLALARQHGFPYWLAFMRIIKGWALIDRDDIADGVAELTEGLAKYREIEGRLYWPMAYRALAEGHVKQGQTDRALEALRDALAAVEETEERWFEVDLYRFKGDVLALEGRSAEAETVYTHAVTLARSQGARAWELRAATSLARLWRGQGKAAEARALLAPIYDLFTEGMDTRDLRQAKILLDELI